MAQLLRDRCAPGRMLAVGARKPSCVRSWSPGPRRAIAAVNGPRQTVLAGTAAAVAALEPQLTARSSRSRPLETTHAFHSPLVEPMLEAFGQVAAQVTYQRPQWPYVSSLTGTWAQDEVASADYWCRHLRQTVRFHDALHVPAPPRRPCTWKWRGSTLAALVRSTLHNAAPCVLAGLRGDDQEWTQHLTTLGQLYVRGTPLRWSQVWGRRGAKSRCPATRSSGNATGSPPAPRRSCAVGTCMPGPVVHPLLGRRLDLAGHEIIYETDLRSVAYLAEHRLDGVAVFPTTGYLELALAAGREAGFKLLDVRELKIRRPLALGDDQSGRVQVVLTPDGSGLACRILRAAPGKWHTHATCRLEAEPEERAESAVGRAARGAPIGGRALRPLPGAGPGLRAGVSRSAATHRRGRPGLGHGGLARAGGPPRLPGPSRVARRLPASHRRRPPRTNRPHLAPCTPCAIPRGGNRTAADTSAGPRKSPIAGSRRPTAVDIPPSMTRDTRWSASTNCSCSTSNTNRPSQLIYREQWIPKPRTGNRCPWFPGCPRATLLSTWRRVERRLSHRRVSKDTRRCSMTSSVCAPWSCTARWSITALRLSPAIRSRRSELADSMGVLPQHARLLRRLLAMLEEDGYVCGKADWTVIRTVEDSVPRATTCNPDAALTRASGAAAHGSPEIELLQRCARQLLAVLRGETDPLKLLFPADNSISAGDLYRDSVGGRAMNALVAEAVAQVGKALPDGAHLADPGNRCGNRRHDRIDPPAASRQRVRYVFTDIAASFLPQAKERFKDQPNIEFRVLDIERDPTSQGFDPHGFDVIVAANVLHATRNLRDALTHVRRLMAPAGS